ncbi:MAG: hypothetical protein ACO1QS_14555 [Verrucomicrobiota bacterium]
MNLLLYLISQLLSYSIFTWIAYVGIAFSAARYFGLLGMFGGHFAVAILVFLLDIRWITTAMKAPGWNGSPDLDIVFMAGLILRILLINTVLMVVTIPALRQWRRNQLAKDETQVAT